MSTIRDSYSPSSSNRYRRSPPTVNSHNGGYNPGQSSRTVLPPLSSSFASSHPNLQHEQAPSRMSPSRNEVFTPSLNSSYWAHNGHTSMAGHPPYNYNAPFEHLETRHPTQTPYPPRQNSTVPPHPIHQENVRRAPPITIPQAPREEFWGNDYGNSTYSNNYPLGNLAPESTNFHALYPNGYEYHSGLHQASFGSYHNPTVDSRHHTHNSPHSLYLPTEVNPSAHRLSHPVEWNGSQRPETHLVSPYSRPSRDQASLSPEEPSPVDYPVVKKKRKRADAAQLKVLNEVYARTAFPTTEERLELAKKLDMSARSVQIWFQNKRQATRQSRSTVNTLPPILHHPYPEGPSAPVVHAPANGPVPPGTEVTVSPTPRGGPYPPQPPHRSIRELSPQLSPESLRRLRSPESSGRTRRNPGHPY